MILIELDGPTSPQIEELIESVFKKVSITDEFMELNAPNKRTYLWEQLRDLNMPEPTLRSSFKFLDFVPYEEPGSDFPENWTVIRNVFMLYISFKDISVDRSDTTSTWPQRIYGRPIN